MAAQPNALAAAAVALLTGYFVLILCVYIYVPRAAAEAAAKAAAKAVGAVLRVVGAGTERANGYYREDGTLHDKAKYTKVGDDYVVIRYSTDDGEWWLFIGGVGIVYDVRSRADHGPAAGWKTFGSGMDPAPRLEWL